MAHHEWAARSVPKGWATVYDLAAILGVTPRTARRRLKRDGRGLLLTKRWRGTDGRPYSRRVWALRREVLALFLFEDVERSLRAVWQMNPNLRRPLPPQYRMAKWRLGRIAQGLPG